MKHAKKIFRKDCTQFRESDEDVKSAPYWEAAPVFVLMPRAAMPPTMGPLAVFRSHQQIRLASEQRKATRATRYPLSVHPA